MNRCLIAAAIVLALGLPARADFSACLANLRADAARAGVSQATIRQTLSGLQPDMKVLDLQEQQHEFSTPIWDYVAGLVDDERVSDGRAVMAQHARALASAEATTASTAICWRRSEGWNRTSERNRTSSHRWRGGRWSPDSTAER